MLIYTVPVSFKGARYKKDSSTSGVYLYYGQGLTRSYELALEKTRINYTTNQQYKQKDYTFALTQGKPGGTTTIGIHNIAASADAYDGNTLFVGVNRAKNEQVNWGITGYASQYKHNNPKLKVNQVTASMGRYQVYGSKQAGYIEGRVNAIMLNRDLGFGQKKYYSADVSATRYQDKISVTANFWLGKEVFAVRSKGFAVINKTELQKGAYSLEVKYALSPESSLALGWGREMFQESRAANTATASIYHLTLGHSF